MGTTNSKILLNEISWKVDENPVKKTYLYIGDAKIIKIICPIQDSKDKIITIKSNDAFIPLLDIFQAIHKIYESIEQDHIFFEGLELLQTHGKTVTYGLLLGS